MAHNLLTGRLPDAITVAGIRYPIHTDFRRWILVIELLTEDFVEVSIKVDCAAKLIFRGENPMSWGRTAEFYRSLVHGILWFASCGRNTNAMAMGAFSSATEHAPKNGRESCPPVFDFGFDADRIFAAFWQTYGIDLCDPSVKLHFWKFMALLRNLPEETEFMRVVSLRRTDTSKIGDDELRRQVRRAKANVRIRPASEERQKGEGVWRTDR